MPYLRRTLSENSIKQTLSSALKLDTALAAFLLTGMLEIKKDKFEPVIKSQKQTDKSVMFDFLNLHEEGLNATYYDNWILITA
jgi:hypothetical protein